VIQIIAAAVSRDYGPRQRMRPAALRRRRDVVERSPTDELAGLRLFLEALESPTTTYTRGGVDIKPREVEVLRKEIAYLGQCLARGRGVHA
jgi:hypothetical protein